MGFTPKVKTVLLSFDEDHEFYGLEVRTRVPDIARVAGLIELREFVGAQEETVDEDGVVRLVALLSEAKDIFTDHLVEWNVEVAGVPVPATRAGLDSQPDEFVLNLIAAWMTNTAGVPKRLGKASTSGPPSPEVSLPMEPLSESLAS